MLKPCQQGEINVRCQAEQSESVMKWPGFCQAGHCQAEVLIQELTSNKLGFEAYQLCHGSLC